MDDITTWTQLISNIGFPIVAFCGLFYLYDKTVKELTSTINKIDNTLQHILSHLEMTDDKEVK